MGVHILKLSYDPQAPKLNSYLNDMMEGLTAKVFRTYKATEVFKNSLAKYSAALKLKKSSGSFPNDAISKKLVAFDKANIEVAKHMNHKNMANKNKRHEKLQNHEDKIEDSVNELRDLKKELRKTNVPRRCEP